MAIKNKKEYSRFRIKKRIRKVVSGSADRPRLSVFKSNKQIYAQLIDDISGKTICSASTIEKEVEVSGTKIDQAKLIGQRIAQKATEAGVQTVVFDRNGYLYHGRVKALAEGAREGGLKL
jgi:large subunit ribosomal protein L18